MEDYLAIAKLFGLYRVDCVFPISTDYKTAATAVIGNGQSEGFSGSALYLAASFFNHSCNPNVHLSFPNNNGTSPSFKLQTSYLCTSAAEACLALKKRCLQAG